MGGLPTNLVACSIIANDRSRYFFKHPYLYYFFIAKKIAEDYSKSGEIRSEVRNLLENLHKEDCANILVFITHHTKDDWILEEVQIALMELFDEQPMADLSIPKIQFLENFILNIPSLVMESRVVSEERKKRNRHLDSISQDSKNPESRDQTPDPSTVDSDILYHINKVFKAIEIAGQIVRNRHNSLPRKTLLGLIEEGAGSGLRFLNYFINLSDQAKAEIIRMIEDTLKEYPDISDEEVQRNAEDLFYHLTYSSIHNTLQKIAASIGSKEAHEVYRELESSNPTPAICLINRSIEMQFRKEVQIDQIQKTSKLLAGNAVATRILRQLAIQHTYMFPVEYQQKQQLSEILGITVRHQHVIDSKKRHFLPKP